MLKPPYTITTDVSNYTEGQMITVTLQANATAFRGFLLQARNQNGPVGTFTVMRSDSQLLTCTTEGSTVSHTSNVNKSTVVAQWKAPNFNNADIRFRLGYAIQFARRPPKFSGIRFTSVRAADAPVLRAEIATLLAKDAIEPVPPADMKSGFYSPYFIVPKKGVDPRLLCSPVTGAAFTGSLQDHDQGKCPFDIAPLFLEERLTAMGLEGWIWSGRGTVLGSVRPVCGGGSSH
ncbi:hypothetical protein QQF64_014791 [Cirrhinus molitorella]|uniref:Reelin domain-containing protein n=1 Tax=Cirrhinus molitorella TaxID=172907 RepID=A0ABR3NUB8_9TELE